MLAHLNYVAAAVCFFGAIAALGGATSGDPAFISMVGIVCGLSMLFFSCGYGLWTLKPWGRTLQLTLSWLGLLVFPLGIFVLWYLYRPGIKILFSGRSIGSRSSD